MDPEASSSIRTERACTAVIRVDCLMPTLATAERDRLRARAVDSFLLQDVPEGWEVELHFDWDERLSLGAKINRMVARSRADYFVLLDDDDWHNRTRVMKQVKALVEGSDFSGSSKIYYFDVRTGESYLYDGDGTWLGGLAFTRAVWVKCNFIDKTSGVDYIWQRMCAGKKRDLADPALFVASIHSENTCRKHTGGDRWTKLSSSSVLPASFLAAFQHPELARA